MSGWQVQHLDLEPFEQQLEGLDPRGALFLGCSMSDGFAAHLRDGGALVFPTLPDLPFDPWRSTLYTPVELYDGLPDGYGYTPDAVIHAWAAAAGPGPRAACWPPPCTTARSTTRSRSSPRDVTSSG